MVMCYVGANGYSSTPCYYKVTTRCVTTQQFRSSRLVKVTFRDFFFCLKGVWIPCAPCQCGSSKHHFKPTRLLYNKRNCNRTTNNRSFPESYSILFKTNPYLPSNQYDSINIETSRTHQTGPWERKSVTRAFIIRLMDYSHATLTQPNYFAV